MIHFNSERNELVSFTPARVRGLLLPVLSNILQVEVAPGGDFVPDNQQGAGQAIDLFGEVYRLLQVFFAPDPVSESGGCSVSQCS